MKITILNAYPEPSAFDGYLAQVKHVLEADHSVTQLDLRDLKIGYCIGCWGCWVKTPGECASRDESCQVCRAVIQSDFTLWAAPLRMGFPSALLKKVMDKSIPLVHPYFVVDHGEAHHLSRYDHYPRLGLLVEAEADTDKVDIHIVGDVFARTALNMKSCLEFILTTGSPAAEIANRILMPAKKPVPLMKSLAPTQGVQISPPSRLSLFNGSPRGRKGNTPIFLRQLGEGFASHPGNAYEMFHLNHLKQTDQFVQAFSEAECAWLGFPLYTDAMPGMVKHFIDALAPLRGRAGNPPVGFLVQSGFPEATHSRHIERYLEKLAARLDSPYVGTIVKGSGEGVRLMPDEMNRKLFDGLQSLGKILAEQGRLDPILMQELAKPERYPGILAPLFKIYIRLPISKSFWDNQLKKNNAYERRYAKPYSD
jgi:multimeric flavodoxin WrbA